MNKYMELAIQEGEYGIKHKHGGPFGCVIVKDGRILAKTHNEVLKRHDATNHAEVRAIQVASKKLHNFNLSGCELYVTGRPCPMCKAAILWAKISKVYYGCDYEDAKEIGFDEENGNSQNYFESQIDQLECRELYNEYTKMEHSLY